MRYTPELFIDFLKKLVEFDNKYRSILNNYSGEVRAREAQEKKDREGGIIQVPA